MYPRHLRRQGPPRPATRKPAASIPIPKESPPGPTRTPNSQSRRFLPNAKTLSSRNGTRQLVRTSVPQSARIKRRGLQHERHDGSTPHYPLGSIVRVTNVKTGSTALVRITDRGPFIPGRVLDLSLAAARKLDVWKPGVAEVKVELMQSAGTLGTPGKWAVQIGGFTDEPLATKLADQLTRRYHTAKVLRFSSPAGDWWIRVRVLDDDHERAQKLAAETTTSEGAVFLVRLD